MNQEALEAEIVGLYYPGYYLDGAELCLEVLEVLELESEVALVYLSLFLAAQGKSECLEVAETFTLEMTLNALAELAFGSGAAAEAKLYGALIAQATASGGADRLETFLAELSIPDPPEPRVETSPRGLTSSIIDVKE